MARRRRGGRMSQRAKFRSAAKKCKGKKRPAFKACMKRLLKK